MADVLSGRPAVIPYDIQTEQAALERRRALLKALAVSALNSGSPVVQAGNRVVPNWGDAISRLVNAYLYATEGKQLQEDEGRTAEKLRSATKSALENYLATKQGVPPQEITGPPQPGEAVPMMTAGIEKDPIRAAVEAVASGLPEMRVLGMEDIRAKAQEPKIMSINGRLVSVPPGGGAPQTLGDFREPKVMDVNGQLVRVPPEGAPQAIGDYRTQFEPPVMLPKSGGYPGGPVQFEKGTGRARWGPAPTTLNVDMKGENALSTGLGSGTAKNIIDQQGILQSGLSQLPHLQTAMKLIDSAQTGITADWVLGARRLLIDMGATPDEAGKVSSSQTLLGILGRYVLEDVKKLGAGVAISNTDREYAAKINLADLQSDPRAMKDMMRIRVATLMNMSEQYDKNLRAAQRGFPGAATMLESYFVPADFGAMPQELGIIRDSSGRWSAMTAVGPQAPPMGPQAPPPTTADEYLRRKGLR